MKKQIPCKIFRLFCRIISPRQSFPAEGRENKLKSVFSGDMRIGKNTSQPASVALGRPLTQGCMQRAALSLKNASIFEKHIKVVLTCLQPSLER
ncbi:hypothetical protein [Pseudoflavonifractor sp. An187]|uniref:hypothetical protein n=1 Tax=Pseudoflavonifractor sp. An187 TaxID=1965578 RepID=UPI00117B70F3|nr:hypothetical protein [Pseudoflavonifractor sp. An187]HJB99919.1 hypothetical protein [Candidatus Flavonifractor merdavium]